MENVEYVGNNVTRIEKKRFLRIKVMSECVRVVFCYYSVSDLSQVRTRLE